MAQKTRTSALREMMDDLSKENFSRFCDQLLDRRGEPRVRRSQVEGKSRWEVAAVLVSTFTEAGAVRVASETLRQILCNEDAETLDSKTKHFEDMGDPTFRKTPTGMLDLEHSQESLKYAAGQWPLRAARRGDPPQKKPEEVEAEAKARVLSEGGDPCNHWRVLSSCTLQFGKYKGQTFKWLLENDMRYAAVLDRLTQYATAYPDFLKVLRSQQEYHRAKDESLPLGQQGKALVGFGSYRSKTLQGLYNSKDKTIISYVQFLRDKESTCTPGSKMETAIRYISRRDHQKAAGANRPATRTKIKPDQTTSASRPVKGKPKRV